MAPTEWMFKGYNGSRFACEWSVAGPRYVVVISHGYGEHIGRYTDLSRDLNRSGAVVIGADHAGHGRSAGTRVSIDDLDDVAHDLSQLITHARGRYRDLPVTLIGHSLGGLVATRYAQIHPGGVDRLVLSSPVLGRWRPVERLLQMDALPDAPLPAELLSRDPEVGRSYAADPLVWHGGFHRHTLQAIGTALERSNGGPKLDHIPVLWVHGTDDRLVPLDGTRVGFDNVFGADVIAHHFDGARHELFNEVNRQEVVARVVDFVTAAEDSVARR
ncbi:alpha/beta fold hydrolase [Mycolicibacterium litorale]|uniref:alpha/beta fold hydrolase n=1 Tax=Mycolicibacterium litorale TaxID=758802 RepID=UPI003CF223D2